MSTRHKVSWAGPWTGVFFLLRSLLSEVVSGLESHEALKSLHFSFSQIELLTPRCLGKSQQNGS